MSMTSDAKLALANTIKSLRARLLEDLHGAVESAYRMSVRMREAGLEEAARIRRGRFEAWIEEQVRTAGDAASGKASRSKEFRDGAHFRREVEKQAAYTLLNRLVLLRLMEAPGLNGKLPLRAPAVVSGGFESNGYKEFRAVASALVRGDDTEGYAFLLQLVCEDLAHDLPGLFGPQGVADLVPVPASTLRHAIDALNARELDTCWSDDMTLGWVYQYWNDPEREELDAKLNRGGKIEPHEVASKTQMFTERYMVDWLLQNSLGPMWLALCAQRGWTPEVVADGTLERLEARRVEWRAKRDAGEVALTELMPLHTESERRWAYYVPQPIPPDAVAEAPDSVWEIRLLDPAVGSGHFLVVALDLLLALYCEEARHQGEGEPDGAATRTFVEHILEHNLHGIDLDPRAVQIAAAALWLKARQLAPDAEPERLNLVASNLRLASLADNDPALVELRREVERETGLPAKLTDALVHALRGADHLGSLLKVDREVDEALAKHEAEQRQRLAIQGELFTAEPARGAVAPQARAEARTSILERLEGFLARHTGGDDLGLRLRGEQLATGVRFVRMLREGTYDLVVANPPYQGTSKLAQAGYVERMYPLGKADLYAAFLLRGLQLVREGGVSAMLTMRNWMFLKQYAALRAYLLESKDLRAIGDFDRGAFESVPDEVVSVAVSVFARQTHTGASVALCPTAREDRSRDNERTARKRAATLCHVGHQSFDLTTLKVVPEWPLVYWWGREELDAFRLGATIGAVSPARQGLATADNTRFLRRPWEVAPSQIGKVATWAPYIKGAAGRAWMEPLDDLVHWERMGLQIRSFERNGKVASRPQNKAYYFRVGVAFSMIGSDFVARAHRVASVFGHMGSSIFADDIGAALCTLNSSRARTLLRAMNPGVHFEVGDVNRLPLFAIQGSGQVLTTIDSAFSDHEAHREPSCEFKGTGPSPWRTAQVWAQAAVDQPVGFDLPKYVEVLDSEAPTDPLSFALGIALGRFSQHPVAGRSSSILDPTECNDPGRDFTGILFLNGTLDDSSALDGLGEPEAALLHESWAERGAAIAPKRTLREWLALDFFKDVHRPMYENRPIHWPLSSSAKTFVAWVNIHRFTERTLRLVLADHLQPALARLDGQLADLRTARDGADAKAGRAAEKPFERLQKARAELAQFITDVEQCADRGAPPTDHKCPAREVDARYAPDLDDGVMINSAALWPLLEPQWKDPKKWWTQLAKAEPAKDYDWSHLAMRYWPTRVDAKCQIDPSLGVAHGCFWRYHPGRAWAWELRLQDEIGPEFRIEEAPYQPGGREVGDAGDAQHRDAWLVDHPTEALGAIEKEAVRRMGRGAKRKGVETLRLLETGLWSNHAQELWDMELRLAQRQRAELRILAPDEPEARAAFVAEDPERLVRRTAFLASLAEFFGQSEDDSSADEAPEEESDDGLDAGGASTEDVSTEDVSSVSETTDDEATAESEP